MFKPEIEIRGFSSETDLDLNLGSTVCVTVGKLLKPFAPKCPNL